MDYNRIIGKLGQHFCLNKRSIAVLSALLMVVILFYPYLYTYLNEDPQFLKKNRNIYWREFIANSVFKNSVHKRNGLNIAKSYQMNNTSHSNDAKPDKMKDKVILFWNTFCNFQDWNVGFGQRPFANCKYKNCITTNDKTKLLESDAMLCHMRSKGCTITDLPKERKPNQYWIFFLRESQANSLNGRQLMPLTKIFNLTITFKLGSNITVLPNGPNAVIRKVQDKNYHFYQGKTASIAWVASNCVTHGAIQGRMHYLLELERHIQVKRYGRCKGHAACAKKRLCFIELAKKHKFYFAAENSLCKDYITEKPWNALYVGMIPIVYGLGDYSKALPPHSYIDVRDFKHPRLLADYLKEVASNETLYNSYFKWREEYKHLTTSSSSDYMCRLCAFLNKPDPPKSIIHNLDKFWSAEMDCVHPHSFNERVMQNK